MAKQHFANISFNGRGSVGIYLQPGETHDDISNLSSADLFERIINKSELVDLIDEDDIDIDDIEDVDI